MNDIYFLLKNHKKTKKNQLFLISGVAKSKKYTIIWVTSKKKNGLQKVSRP